MRKFKIELEISNKKSKEKIPKNYIINVCEDVSPSKWLLKQLFQDGIAMSKKEDGELYVSHLDIKKV